MAIPPDRLQSKEGGGLQEGQGDLNAKQFGENHRTSVNANQPFIDLIAEVAAILENCRKNGTEPPPGLKLPKRSNRT